MLAKAMKNLFSSAIRKRGEDYFRMNKAYIASRNKNSINFIVSGSRNYRCSFEQEENSKSSTHGSDRSLNMHCECPYFRDYDYCKHLWASIKEGDSEGIWDDFLNLKNKNPKQMDNTLSDIKEQKSWGKKIDRLSIQNTLHKTDRKKLDHFKVYYALDYYNWERLGLVVHFYRIHNHSSSGNSNLIERKQIKSDDFQKLSDPLDRELILLLTSQVNPTSYWNEFYSHGIVQPFIQNQVLNKLCKTGRLFIESNRGVYDIDCLSFLKFNEDMAGIKTHLSLKGSKVFFDTHLDSGNEKIPIKDLIIFSNNGNYITKKAIGCFEPEHFDWIGTLKELGKEHIPKSDKDFLIQGLFNQEIVTDIELSDNMGWKFKEETPKPKIVIKEEKKGEKRKEIYGKALFKYGDSEVFSISSQKHSVDERNRTLYLRDFDKESEFLVEIESMNFNPTPIKLAQTYNFRIRKDQFVTTIKQMVDKNWEVEAHGKKVEPALSMNFSVTSGVDWFDLESHVTFKSGEKLTLPELIRSLKQGENLISLGNGQYGMLPEEWLKKYSSLTEIGDDKGKDCLRFSKAQGIFLDGWFSEEKDFKKDKDFVNFQK